MAEEQVYRFILQDDGGQPSAPPKPGAAAQGRASEGAQQPPRQPDRPSPPEAPPRQPNVPRPREEAPREERAIPPQQPDGLRPPEPPPTPRPPRAPKTEQPPARQPRPPRTEQPETLGNSVLDAIKKASEYSTVGGFAAQGTALLRPFLDLGRLISNLRGGQEPKPGAAAAGQAAGALGDRPQTSKVSNAIFQAQGAKILIEGGNVERPDRPTLPQRPRTGPESGPSAPPPLPTRSGPPTRTGPLGPPPLPPRPNPGAAAARAGQAASTATGAAAGRAAAGLASLGAVSLTVAGGLSAVVVAAGATVVALKALYSRANQQAKALAGYDGALASAQNTAAIARIQQDIRSARYLGRDLAKLTEAQTRLSIASTRILDVMEKAFLERIVPLLEIIAAGVDNFAGALEWLDEAELDPRLRTLLEGVIKTLIASGAQAIPGGPALLAAIQALGLLAKKEVVDKDLKAGDFYKLFASYNDLGIDDPEGQLGQPAGPRADFDATFFGPGQPSPIP